MVVSRSDSKRRKKEGGSLQESPKRTKVHAQRKFAQGSHLNSPVLTPVKDKDKAKYNGAAPSAELLPIKRPKTEQFVNFLCFRGSDMLPKSLEFFNEPSVPEPLAGEEDLKRDGASTSGGLSRSGQRTSDKHGDQAGGVAKAEARNKSRSKPMAAVQALKKKYQEQRMNKEKRSLTKLALKVKGKNMMRTRSAGPLEEKPVASVVSQKKSVRTSRLVTPGKNKAMTSPRKTVMRKHPVVVKRSSKSVTRGGLRSAGELPPGSDEGIKTERKPRKFIKTKASAVKKSIKKATVASSLSDFSSDDDQPLVKKQKVISKASILASRVTTRSRLTKPSTSQTFSSRPPRKTKEAATLFMEMLKKDLRSPDEEDDNVDTMSVDSYGDTPKRTERRESKDSIENSKSEKKTPTKMVKKETKPNDKKLPIKINRKLPDRPASRITCLKTRTLRRNSYRLVAKEIELKRLKSTRAKIMNKMPSRSSSKDIPQDDSEEAEKPISKGNTSERDNRRERRSNPNKASENTKQQKAVTKESDISSSKVSKKKSTEVTFDDSDEEPLGKKVNQNSSPSALKGLKKKPVSEKKEISNCNKSEVIEQKLTRRRSLLNTSQDSTREDFKQSVQFNAKDQPSLKDVESESSGKAKSESTPKPGNSNSGTLNLKSKLVAGAANEANLKVTPKPKETEKSTVQNKKQIEKKGKKSESKIIERDKSVPPLGDNVTIPEKEKKQASKSGKKSNCKKSLDVKGDEISIKNIPKSETKLPKSSSDNIPKKDNDSSLNINRDNLDESKTVSKNISVKNLPESDKEVIDTKNLNELSSNTVCDKSYIPAETDTHTSESGGFELSDKGVKTHDNIPAATKESVVDSRIGFDNCKDNTPPSIEKPPKIMQTKFEQVSDDKSVSNPLHNVETTKKKLVVSKNKNPVEISLVGGVDKVESADNKKSKEIIGICKSSLTMKSNFGEIGMNNPPVKVRDESIKKESLAGNGKEVTVVNQSNLVGKQDSQLKVPSINNNLKQMNPSLLTLKSNESIAEKDLALQTTNILDPSSNKHIKAGVLEKLNEEEPSEDFSSPDSGSKRVIEDNVQIKGVLLCESNNKEIEISTAHLGSKLQNIEPKKNEIFNYSQTIGGLNDQLVSKVCYPAGATFISNMNSTSNNFNIETRTPVPKDMGVTAAVPMQLAATVTKPLPLPHGADMGSEGKPKGRNVLSEPTGRITVPELKCTSGSPVLVSGGKIPELHGTKVQTRDLKTDYNKLGTKEEHFIDNSSKLGNLDMSDKISSAVETLMSLKNVHKIDDKSFSIQSGVWKVKGGQNFDFEPKKIHETDLKRPNESEHKHVDMHDSKKIKIKEGEVKRVTIQEPEFKRLNTTEGDGKRINPLDSDFRRYHMHDPKPKPEHPQVLKGCSNPKSMLKPGTLIDIAGISHSPEIMTPLRPGVDGEIIPMNRPIRPFGQESADTLRAGVQGFKPYEPRVEPNIYGYRWQNPNSEKSLKSEQCSEKEVADSKSKTSVNESAWRLAFKNVKDPKSSSNIPTEKPAAKKQLSVTALARKHKSKTEIVSDKNIQPQPSTSIPFLRHNKPFLGPSPTKSKDTGSSSSNIKRNIAEVDPDSLREKEAEVEEFLRQCGEFSRSKINPITPTKVVEDGAIRAPYLPSQSDSSNVEDFTGTNSEQIAGNHNLTDVRYTHKKLLPQQNQSESVPFVNEDLKRAGSPLKFEKRQNQPVSVASEVSVVNRGNLSVLYAQADQVPNKPISSISNFKQDQSLNIFQSDSVRRSNSPKLSIQKSSYPGTDSPKKFEDSSLSSSSSPAPNSGEMATYLGGTQRASSPLSASKQSLPDKAHHFSPSRSRQSVVPDNFFRDSNLNKRTNSPTALDSYSQHQSSPKGNSISRNSNSPVFGKCSTTNIFKEILPAKRSFSPTLLSQPQSDGDAVPNLFSQNQKFRRSVSPLSNRSGFSKLGNANDNNSEATKNIKVIEEKKIETCFEECSQPSVKINVANQSEQKANSLALNLTQPSQVVQGNKETIEESLSVKKEVIDLDEVKSSNLESFDDSNILKQEIQGGNEKLSSFQDTESWHGGSGMSEAKHRLPLPVEQTLKKLGQTRPPQNKKPTPPKVKCLEQNAKDIPSQGEYISVQEDTVSVGISLKENPSIFAPKLVTGIYSHNQEGELDLMQKKKVNMSAEEIKRWLNESSTSEVEHRPNCGILENNTCECEYRNTLASSLQNIDTVKFDGVPKNENITVNKSLQNEFDMLENNHKILDCKVTTTSKVFEAEQSLNVKGKGDENDVLEVIKTEPFVPETSTLKQEVPKNQEVQKSFVSSIVKNTVSTQPKEDTLVPMTNFCIPVSVASSTSTNIKQPIATSPVSKLRTFRLPNKNVETEPKQNTSDSVDISTPARDDASSSNDLSSSNEETPEKSHNERKSIFHQRRSTLKVKERRELIAPSVNAFSPENESSVYAFDPELPPTSTPFRRSKSKDGKSASTTTDDEDLTPSSNSIAVQVNFDNEAVLECSTQTDVQEGDDDDTHTFYIPLQQSAADTSKPPLIQGVAVKVDTEGPDQKVIMRAKLVTKPLSTFNQTSSSPRGLIGTRSGKPEQKVRPLSVKPPVGTVQPTARPKPKPQPPVQDDQPSTSKTNTTCSPQAARLAKRIKSKAAVPSTSAESQPAKVVPAKLVEAPTFYPTEKEFEDPLEYISSITPQAEKYGLCRVVPPSNFKPECKVSDDMRFTAYNQYIHKMLHRWGPNVKEMLAIKKYLATQSIALTHPPWIGGMEVDLPRLYQTVQQCGGLKEVIEKKRWHRVADAMKIPKSAQDRVTKLDDIYCKFLLPYDTLSHVERTQLFEGVEQDWIEREKRVTNQQESSANDEDEESDSDSDSDIDECIVKGRSMALNGFYRIARNTMSMWFPKTDTPSAADVELEFWKHVASRQHHVCVHSGSIDSGAMGYGFPTGKNSSTSRHPWNLKMLTNNPGSILRFLGPIMGVTVPTLHVGMLFSACCWYRDPHGLPWIEYLHTGASKIWYGIPDSSSSQFRDAVTSIVPRLCQDKTLWLASDTAMVPPPLLVEKGVSLSRIVQDPGQFIIVFPKAFTSSICTGYLVSESVYFAQPSWLSSAQALFNDMRESSEPTVFSLDKLLFSIVNDSRASADVLNQILSIVVSLRDGEVAGRRQLEELGLNTSERLNSKRKGKARPAGDGEEDLECEQCRMTLYISWMSNSQEGSAYCLPHAVELLSNKRSLVKHCTLVYAFSEEELEELVEKLKSRVENKTQKKSVARSSKS